MEINLKITADPELIALLTRAVKALEASGQNVEPFGPVITTSPAFIPQEDTDKSHQEPNLEELYDEKLARVKAADISSQELQTNVVKLTVQKPALRASIKAIVNEYADKLSAIPAGQRGLVWERIKQLAEEN